VLFEASSGGGTLFVKDSANGFPVGNVSDLAGGPGLGTQLTVNSSRNATLLLEVNGVTPDTTRFRFLIHTVNRAPESRSARFALGDTVTGESIDDIPDVDDFFAGGMAGKYITGWVEPLGPVTGNSLLSIQISDPTSTLFSSTYGVVGQTVRQLFAFGRLAFNIDYRFTIPAPRTSNLQYTGPYRFHVYEINPAPESAGAAISANSIVSEAIDIGGDFDDFQFPANAGDEFNVFLQSSAARPTSASIVGSIQGGTTASTMAVDTGMFQHATGRFKVLKDTTYGIHVSSQYVSDAVGPYRLYLYRVNRAPESIPAAVTPGDTISGESIDLPGDVDEFTVSGTAGQQFNIFVQTTIQGGQALTMAVRTPGNQVLVGAESYGPGLDLLLQSTGRFTLPETGTYRLTFDGAAGPYRFFVYPINPQPETHAAAIAFRDSIEDESLDVPGDIDQFTFSAPDSNGVTLFLEGAGLGSVEMSVFRAGTGQQIPIDGYYNRFAVGTGSYVLRVQSPGYPGVGAGPYRLWMYPSKPTPETANANLAIGDTIESEQLDPPADVDVFHFDGVKGQHVNVAFQGTSAPTSNGGYTALLYEPSNIMGWVSTPTSSPSLGAQQTTRLDLPATGRYTIGIQGGSSPTQRIEHGPYRLALTAVDTMPEQVGAALVPGDSVTTEQIDTPGDWDQFTVTALPGEDLGLVFQSSGSVNFPMIRASNPVTGDSLARTVGQFVRFAGPFRVPSGGQVNVAVYELARHFYECYDATCGGVFGFTGSYQFKVIRVNRAPETASPTYTLGDTARDAIDVGDIDEFNASATPGGVLTAYLRVTAPPVPSGSGLTLEIIDPATGDILAGQGVQVFGQSQLYPVGSFSVPAGGQFLIRVRGSCTFGDDIITAPYEIQVKP